MDNLCFCFVCKIILLGITFTLKFLCGKILLSPLKEVLLDSRSELYYAIEIFFNYIIILYINVRSAVKTYSRLLLFVILWLTFWTWDSNILFFASSLLTLSIIALTSLHE
jgi:hypothetical protein